MKSEFKFDQALAMLYGVEEAVLLDYLKGWLEVSRDTSRNIYDGFYWHAATAATISGHLKFWSPVKVQRILKKLEDKGAVISGNFNKDKRNRGKWYTMPQFKVKQPK